MTLAPLPWATLELMASVSGFPADAVLHRDVTHALLDEGGAGAITLRLEPDRTVRVRNLILLGSSRERLRTIRRLVSTAKTYGRVHGWAGWAVRMRRDWSFYGPITHLLVGLGGQLARIDGFGNEFWTGEMR